MKKNTKIQNNQEANQHMIYINQKSRRFFNKNKKHKIIKIIIKR